jgi:hypothetical protein
MLGVMKAGKGSALILSTDAEAGISERRRQRELLFLGGMLVQAADPIACDPDSALIDE